MAADWLSFVTPVASLVLGAGGAGGAWAALSARVKAKADVDAAAAKAETEAPANMLNAMAAFQAALNVQTDSLTKGLRDELTQVRDALARADQRIDALEAENRECRSENQQVRGDNRNLSSRIDGLERILREAEIPIPGRAVAGSFIVVEHDHTTTLTPSSEPSA